MKYEEALKIHKDDLVENKIEKAKKNLELISQEKELNKQYYDALKRIGELVEENEKLKSAAVPDLPES